MLESQLFPTPPDVIRKMLQPYVLDREDRWGDSKKYLKNANRILEPSAGNGALLDLMIEEYNVVDSYHRGNRDKARLHCCEIQPELRAILAEKGFTVLETDFLEYREPLTFDLIVMNPPFADGAKHVLHAWEFLDGELVALVNRETVDNPCTKDRQLLQVLIDAHGTVEYFGQCFKDSERPTNVDVACIRLTRKRAESFNFDGEGSWEFSQGIRDEQFNPDTLTRPDVIRDLVARYQAAERLIIERREMQRKLDFLLEGVANPVSDSVSRDAGDSLGNRTSLEDMVLALKSRFWQTFFEKTQLSGRLTSNFQTKFREFSLQKSKLAFSERNIQEIVSLFMMNYKQLMMDCLLEVFDKCTSYHEKNKVHTEGWKTNSGHKINNRVILPYGITFDDCLGFHLSYGGGETFYTDMDKVLCWIWDVDPTDIRSTAASIQYFCTQVKRRDRAYTEQFDSTFFKIRIYKKGTVHLDFKDDKLLAEFNHRAAGGKGWLPGEGF